MIQMLLGMGLLVSPLQAGLDAERAKVVTTLLQQAAAKQRPVGAVVWMENRGESVQAVVGERAVVPQRAAMTLETVFDAASLTKVVATTPSILLLMEQGKIDLSSSVSLYLPEFHGSGREKIRVRDLLTHVSGLKPGIPKEPAWTGYEAGIAKALGAVPDAPPETFFRYSDINFILLGEIVRRVSGTGLDQFAARHLFQPLKMVHTTFLPPASWQEKIAPTERDENGVMLRGVVHDPTARKMGGVAGHAGLFTCAEDLARYARMILQEGMADGVRILKPETIRLMRSVQTPITVWERRGLGWDIDSVYSRPRGSVFPVGSFGHTGFTGTALWIDPYSQSFFVFLSSRLHPDGAGDIRPLYEQVGGAVAQAVKDFDFTQVPDALFRRSSPDEVPTVLNGIDVLSRRQFSDLAGLRVGLITNHTGLDQSRVSTIDLLAKAPHVKLRALFSPEHGIRGELDQEKISDSIDKKTGLPIRSLYGETKAPTSDQLAELDALVFDIQDIGCRFYTYISTLRLCMEAAAKAGKKFIVLDRVNPIGGTRVEGPAVLDAETFTATHAVPIRHGMTTGELARMLNQERAIGVDLQVIEMMGWQRSWWFDQTALPWVNPSPNMRHLHAATLYPGIGLMEFSISVGRGTDTPFEILGAPYMEDGRLAYELNKLGLVGIRFIPVRFTPTASIFKGEACQGVRLVLTDREACEPVRTGLAIITTLKRLYPTRFALAKVNTLLNHKPTLKAIETGADWRVIVDSWSAQKDEFVKRREPFLLYR